MQRLFSLLALLLVHAFQVFGQQQIMDSLSNALKLSNDRIQRTDILNELSSSCYDFDSEKGFEYASQAYDLSNSLNYFKGLRRSLTLQGYYFFLTGKYPAALEFYRRSSNLQMPEDDLLGYNYAMVGNTFRSLAQYDSAEFFYTKSINLLFSLNASDQLAFSYKNLGRLYVVQWKNQEAEETFKKALAIYQTAKKKHGIADTWFSLSDISVNKADFSQAQEYIEKACTMADDINDEFLMTLCLINKERY